MLACLIVELVGTAQKGGSALFGVSHKAGVGSVAGEVGGDLQSLLGAVKVADRVGLHPKIGKYASYVATGVADTFGNDGLGELIASTKDETIGIRTGDDGVEGEVAA